MKNVANATNYLDIDTKELFRIYSKNKDNKEIYILNPKSNVKKIFTITGLDKIFKMEG